MALGLNQFSRRYVYHMLARVHGLHRVRLRRPDLFDKYVDRDGRNPLDIEHIWADDYSQYAEAFKSLQDFDECRNNLGGLLLLPADVNRSYKDKPFAQKAPHYAKQDLYSASLTAAAYEHQPQFVAFVKKSGLPFRPYQEFGKEEQLEDAPWHTSSPSSSGVRIVSSSTAYERRVNRVQLEPGERDNAPLD